MSRGNAAGGYVIPFAIDIALRRCTHHHPAGLAHTTGHSFDIETIGIGWETIDAGGEVYVAVYPAERAIVGCFSLMHQEGSCGEGTGGRGSSPSKLLVR